MDKRLKDEIEEEIDLNGHESSDAALELVRYIFNTPTDKLAEMTNIPLDQIYPLSMIKTYALEAELLAKDMVDAQKVYSTICKVHNPFRPTIDVELDTDYDLKSAQLLILSWLTSYFQLRRSISGDLTKDAVTLAQDQMASQQMQPTDDWGNALRKQ